MDAITLLKKDHDAVKKLFSEFEKTTDRASKKRQELATKIVEELTAHAAIEEEVFYPAIREALPDVTDDVLEALEEHHVAKWLTWEISGMTPDDERFKAKVMVLTESVKHHMEEEETGLFPEVRKAFGRKQLAEIGEALAAAKQTAPTVPAPMEPDTPPGNLKTQADKAAMQKAKKAATDGSSGKKPARAK